MDELYHHGIKGMKWGVRRYQNDDGSYTPEGKKRYSRTIEAEKELAKRRSDYNELAKRSPSLEQINAQNRLIVNSQTALKNAKTLDDIDAKGLSKSAKKYEKKYLDKGYSEEDAKIAAYNRDKATKVLAVAGTAAVVGIAAYSGYKYYQRNADRLITNDLYRFSPNDGKGLHDAFYATPHKRDAKKYVGLYGGGQMGGAGPFGLNKGYQKTISVGKEGLRVAGDKSGRKVLSGLMTDKSFQDDFRDGAEEFLQAAGPRSKQGSVMKKALKDLDSGKTDSKAIYEAFNMALAGQSSRKDKFLSALKDAGYDAVIDVNDQRKSGYNAKLPVIVFNTDKAQVSKVREVGKAEMARVYNQEVKNIQIKQLAAQAGASGAAIGAIVGGSRANETSQNRKAVREYRKEHPNTKMTDLQILDSAYSK